MSFVLKAFYFVCFSYPLMEQQIYEYYMNKKALSSKGNSLESLFNNLKGPVMT